MAVKFKELQTELDRISFQLYIFAVYIPVKDVEHSIILSQQGIQYNNN